MSDDTKISNVVRDDSCHGSIFVVRARVYKVGERKPCSSRGTATVTAVVPVSMTLEAT